MTDTTSIITDLYAVLQSRRGGDAASSYVASLYAAGLDRILQKVGEEAVETILAAKAAQSGADSSGGHESAVISEVADLWFHTLVMLAALDLRPDQVLAELVRRFGASGLQGAGDHAGSQSSQQTAE